MDDFELDLAHLTQLRQECIDNLYLSAANVKKYLDNDKDDKINILKMCLQDYIVSEAQQEKDIEALNRVTEVIDLSNVNEIEHEFTRLRENVRVIVDRDPRMAEFRKRTHLNGKAVSQNPNESDISITVAEDRCVIDPITKRPIQDPIRNTRCGHIYEHQTILQHIKRKNRARCPVAGCKDQEPLRVENLVPNAEYMPQLFEETYGDESNMELSQEY